MKKILTLTSAIILSISALFAQNAVEKFTKDNFMGIGAQAGYSYQGATIGGHLDFNAGQVRGRFGIDTFFGPHFTIGTNIAFHYLFNLPVEGLSIYPIGGFNFEYCGAYTHPWHLGLDLGAGVEYDFGNGWAIFVDGKYDIRLAGQINSYRSYFGFTKAF